MTPFANPLIRAVPPAVNIVNITNAIEAVITTATPHGYFSGIYCTINIPYPNVMPALNGKTYLMVVGSPTTLIPIISFAPGLIGSFIGVDTTTMGPWAAAPNVTCTVPQPQPRPPLPPIPPKPPVTFTVPGQQAQLIPAAERSFTRFPNVSDIIGPNNPPIPPPGN